MVFSGGLFCRSLTSINLFGNTSDTGPVTSVGFRRVADAIRCHHAGDRIQKLILSRNTALGDAGMLLLADALPATVALTHLDISNTGFSDAGLVAIATALGRTQTMDAAVGQPACRLSDPPVGVLADSISMSCRPSTVAVGANLTELILYGNAQAKGPGWRALAEVLPQLVNLRRLDCRRCAGMGCDGAAAFAAVLPVCTALQCLLLARCSIGDRGGQVLAKAFTAIASPENRQHQSLDSIDASWNRLTGECVKAIVNACARVGWSVEQTPGGFCRGEIK